MALYNGTITFGASGNKNIATELSLPSAVANAAARRVLIEPLRANTHAAWVGYSSLTNVGANKIQELAQPPAATVPLDRFLDVAAGSDHNIDPTAYCVAGTSGEGVTVTVWSI